MLGPAAGFGALNAQLVEPIAQNLQHPIEPGLAIGAFFRHQFLNFPIGIRLKIFKRQIFQFPLKAPNAQTIGQGRENIHGFLGNSALFFRSQMLQSSHIVQAIGQFHHNHPNVLGHRQKHSPEIFRLLLFFTREIKLRKLRDPFHQKSHFCTKLGFQIFRGCSRVFHNIV